MTTLRCYASDELGGLLTELSDLDGVEIDIHIPDSTPAIDVFRAVQRAGFDPHGRLEPDGALRLRSRSVPRAPSMLDRPGMLS